MVLRLVSAALVAALVAICAACVPKVKSARIATPYPLRDFVGPDTIPAAPAGTMLGVDLTGPWRVASVELLDGDATVEHLFEPGWFLLAADRNVASVQGVPPEWYLPDAVDWQLNRVDERGVALGFGFATPRGNVSFLHYAFVGAATDLDHVDAIEAVHFEDEEFRTIRWAMWSVRLERIVRPPDVMAEPALPSWPR